MEQTEAIKKMTLDRIARYETLREQRKNWESHWQQLADYLAPRKADITKKRTDGDKRTELIYDGTAIHASELLTASLHGMMTSASSPWFELKFSEEELNQTDEAKEWLESAQSVMYDAFERSNFQEQIHELYSDLVVFGTGVMFIESNNDDGLRFQTRHIAECYLSEDQHGRVDTVIRKYKMVGRDVRKMFGENLSKDMFDRIADDPYQTVELLHFVMPRDDFDPSMSDNLNMPFLSCYIDHQNEHLISEGGFREFPYVAPRFLKASYEIGYGRSPGMTSLPDVKMLQEMAKTTIEASQKAINPPMLVPDDGFVMPVRVTPGGLNFYRSGTRDRIEPLITAQATPLGLDIENQRREAIRQAFYVDQLLLRESPNMTATEVISRNEEKMRLLGPVLGRLQRELLQPLIQRSFNLLKEQKVFAPAPEFLRENAIGIEYVSPMAKAQRQGQIDSTMRMFEILTPLAQLDPNIFDFVDMDGLVKFVAKTVGTPAAVLRGEAEVLQLREQRSVVQQQQQELAQAQQLAETAGSAAPALKAIQGSGNT